MKVFNYIYYRLTKFYMKWDGEFASTALIGLSCFQAMILGNSFLILNKYFLKFKIENLGEKLSVVIITLMFFLCFINYIYYRNKYDFLNKKYRDEKNDEKKINGFLVILALLSQWITIFFLGKLYN